MSTLYPWHDITSKMEKLVGPTRNQKFLTTNLCIFKILHWVWSFAKTDQWVSTFFQIPPKFQHTQTIPIAYRNSHISLHQLTGFGSVLVDIPGAEKNGTSWKHMPHCIYQGQVPVNCNHWRILKSTIKRLDILQCACIVCFCFFLKKHEPNLEGGVETVYS